MSLVAILDILVKSFTSQLAENLLHCRDIRLGFFAGREELQTRFNLALKLLAELGSGLDEECIQTGGDRALICEEATDLSAVLGGGLSDKRTSVQDPVLGRVASGVHRPEESLLGAEDLDRRGRVLGEGDERPSLGEQLGADLLPDEGGEVRGDHHHAVAEVRLEVVKKLELAEDTVAEADDRGLRSKRRKLEEWGEGTISVGLFSCPTEIFE